MGQQRGGGRRSQSQPGDSGESNAADVNAADNTSRSQGQSVESGELRSGLEVRTALIEGRTFRAKAVQYTVIDGLAIFEGDIVLGTAEQTVQRTEALRAEMTGAVASGVVITGDQFRWPNCRIPYTIDPGLPNQNRVTDAIAHWQAQT